VPNRQQPWSNSDDLHHRPRRSGSASSVQALKTGAVGFLSKPFNADITSQKILRHLIAADISALVDIPTRRGIEKYLLALAGQLQLTGC
jgi:hypothetical protein